MAIKSWNNFMHELISPALANILFRHNISKHGPLPASHTNNGVITIPTQEILSTVVYISLQDFLIANGHEQILFEPHEFPAWEKAFEQLIPEGENNPLRGSCIAQALYQPQGPYSPDDHAATLERFLSPLASMRRYYREIPETPAEKYLLHMGNMQQNIDIQVLNPVEQYLKAFEADMPNIRDFYYKFIHLDNGIKALRVTYSKGYLENQGINLVYKPDDISQDRRNIVSRRQIACQGSIHHSSSPNGSSHIVIHIPAENILRIFEPEVINQEELKKLKPADQLLQISRLLRFNCRFPDQTIDPNNPHQLRLSDENLSIIKDVLSQLDATMLTDMSLELAASIASEFIASFFYHPETTMHVLNSVPKSLFPYLNRDFLTNPEAQNQITSTLHIPLGYPQTEVEIDGQLQANYDSDYLFSPLLPPIVNLLLTTDPQVRASIDEFLSNLGDENDKLDDPQTQYNDEFINWYMKESEYIRLAIAFSPSAIV
jgi:hypothetical protein